VTATAVQEGQLKALAKSYNVSIEEARKRYQERGISRYYPPSIHTTMVPGMTVEGTITNERGEPLAGVSVVVTNKRGRGPAPLPMLGGVTRSQNWSPTKVTALMLTVTLTIFAPWGRQSIVMEDRSE